MDFDYFGEVQVPQSYPPSIRDAPKISTVIVMFPHTSSICTERDEGDTST